MANRNCALSTGGLDRKLFLITKKKNRNGKDKGISQCRNKDLDHTNDKLGSEERGEPMVC